MPVDPFILFTIDVYKRQVQQLNLALMEKGVSLINRTGGFDIVHAHDWLAAYAGRGLKHIYHLPLIATIHATEHGRNGGLFTEEQRYIGEVEWQLIYESWKTICCSRFMEDELVAVFQTPRDKIEIIPNGVRPESFQISRPDPTVRDRFAPHGEKIIFYVGRLVQEKGVQVLLNALPLVREQFPDVRLVIAGTGPYEEELQRQSAIRGLDPHVVFGGYIDDYTRNQLYHWSSVAVFPSLYEPFGIVALEAMAAGTPVVVGDVGGFQETVTPVSYTHLDVYKRQVGGHPQIDVPALQIMLIQSAFIFTLINGSRTENIGALITNVVEVCGRSNGDILIQTENCHNMNIFSRHDVFKCCPLRCCFSVYGPVYKSKTGGRHPVSYTHLNQAIGMITYQPAGDVIARNRAQRIAAVSYTHLDVYKRQY